MSQTGLPGALQGALNIGNERRSSGSRCGWFDAQQVGPAGQRPRDGPGRLAHAPPERIANDRIAAILPNCVPDLGVYAAGLTADRYESGTDGTRARPGAGALQLPEGGAGLDSSKRSGGHEQLRR